MPWERYELCAEPCVRPTTQIDHILVTPAGVFVIETKHYIGRIVGDSTERELWLVQNRKKRRIRNPVFQNYGHVKELQRLTGISFSVFHNLIVFSGKAQLGAAFGPNALLLADLQRYFNAPRCAILDEATMRYVIGTIEVSRLPRSAETDEYHVQSIVRQLRAAA